MKRVFGNVSGVKCCNCGKFHDWDEETCEIYEDDYLCHDCFRDYFGYCNVCGELNRYTDMNELFVKDVNSKNAI